MGKPVLCPGVLKEGWALGVLTRMLGAAPRARDTRISDTRVRWSPAGTLVSDSRESRATTRPLTPQNVTTMATYRGDQIRGGVGATTARDHRSGSSVLVCDSASNIAVHVKCSLFLDKDNRVRKRSSLHIGRESQAGGNSLGLCRPGSPRRHLTKHFHVGSLKQGMAHKLLRLLEALPQECWGEDEKCGQPLRARALQYDVAWFKAVLAWAVGAGLLDRNPLVGYASPAETSPRRPIVTASEYEALLAASERDPSALPTGSHRSS